SIKLAGHALVSADAPSRMFTPAAPAFRTMGKAMATAYQCSLTRQRKLVWTQAFIPFQPLVNRMTISAASSGPTGSVGSPSMPRGVIHQDRAQDRTTKITKAYCLNQDVPLFIIFLL